MNESLLNLGAQAKALERFDYVVANSSLPLTFPLPLPE
jgi:hypothetical protein